MRHLAPPCLLLAACLVGCAAPKPTATALTPAQARQAKVASVTHALSFTQNAPLQKATQSLQQVSAELSKASFKQVSAALGTAFASAGGPLVAAGSLGLAANQGGGLAAALQRDTYSLAAVAAGPDGQGQVSYDEATGELTAIENAGTRLQFAYAKLAGNQRTATITIAASPDGTTGTLKLSATAASWAKQPAGNAPYTFMANETPVEPTAMALELSLVPQGDPALALTAKLDADEQALTLLGKAFTHLRLTGALPRVALDLDAHVKQSTLDLAGTITVETPDGKEPFGLAAHYDVAKAKGQLDLTLVNAKARINASTGAKAAVVYSTEDGSRIGQVDPPNPAEPGVLVIRFDDGSTTRWELLPKELLPAPVAPAAAPPPFS